MVLPKWLSMEHSFELCARTVPCSSIRSDSIDSRTPIRSKLLNHTCTNAISDMFASYPLCCDPSDIITPLRCTRAGDGTHGEVCTACREMSSSPQTTLGRREIPRHECFFLWPCASASIVQYDDEGMHATMLLFPYTGTRRIWFGPTILTAIANAPNQSTAAAATAPFVSAAL